MPPLHLWPALYVALLVLAGTWAGPIGLLVAGGLASLLLPAMLLLWWSTSPPLPPVSGRVLAPCAVSLLASAFASYQSELPPGMDSSFHCTVALHFQNVGRLTDNLRPLEDLTLNYPTGSHFLVAATSAAARAVSLEMAPHESFKLWCAITQIVACLVVAGFEPLLARGNGTCTAWVFAFGLFQISLYPYTWGGLPCQLAMTFFMAGLLAVVARPDSRAILPAGLFWGAAMATHHHSAVAIALGTLSVAVITSIRKRSFEMGAVLVTSLVVAVGMSAPYWWRLLRNLPHASRTGILGYVEPLEMPWELLVKMGPVFLVGVVLLVRGEILSIATGRLFAVLALAWAFAFGLLDYGTRTVSVLLAGKPVTPFTPSRFLFDLQWALCPLIGAELSKRARGWPRTTAVALLCLVTGVAYTWERWTATPLTDLPRWVLQGRLRRPEGTIMREDIILAPGAYVAAHAPLDTVVLGTPGHVWLTYCTQRESTGLFIPVSEPISDRIRLKWELLRAPTKRPWEEWSRELGNVPIWAILPHYVRLPGERVVGNWHPIKVVILWQPPAPSPDNHPAVQQRTP